MAYAELDLDFEFALASRCRGPFNLLAGPPGSGKSTKGRGIVRTFNAKLKPNVQGIRFWSFNLSRMSPIEFGYILIPNGRGGLARELPPHFKLPTEGDVVEWTEFGRAHPQVQAAFIDIMSSGELDGTELPWVFNYATSNDRIFRSSAMKDRFMVSVAPDPRRDSEEHKLIRHLIINEVGLTPDLHGSQVLMNLVGLVIGPTYDGFSSSDSGAEVPAVEYKGLSTRNVVGRLVQRALRTDNRQHQIMLQAVVDENNRLALESAMEYFILMPGAIIPKQYLKSYMDLERRSDQFAEPVRQQIRKNRIIIERSLS